MFLIGQIGIGVKLPMFKPIKSCGCALTQSTCKLQAHHHRRRSWFISERWLYERKCLTIIKVTIAVYANTIVDKYLKQFYDTKCNLEFQGVEMTRSACAHDNEYSDNVSWLQKVYVSMFNLKCSINNFFNISENEN